MINTNIAEKIDLRTSSGTALPTKIFFEIRSFLNPYSVRNIDLLNKNSYPLRNQKVVNNREKQLKKMEILLRRFLTLMGQFSNGGITTGIKNGYYTSFPDYEEIAKYNNLWRYLSEDYTRLLSKEFFPFLSSKYVDIILKQYRYLAFRNWGYITDKKTKILASYKELLGRGEGKGSFTCLIRLANSYRNKKSISFERKDEKKELEYYIKTIKIFADNFGKGIPGRVQESVLGLLKSIICRVSLSNR